MRSQRRSENDSRATTSECNEGQGIIPALWRTLLEEILGDDLRGETLSGHCVQGVGQLTIADWTFEKALMAWRYIASGIRPAKTRPTFKR